jgi:HPt (histidine-containing phosphotransfer) domain-containing protein
MCLEPAAIDRLHKLGGANLVGRMIDAYLENTPLRLEDARNGWRIRDLGAVERAAHSLKSSSANFGAVQLVELTSQIERLAAVGDQERLIVLMKELPSLFEAVRRCLVEVEEGLVR